VEAHAAARDILRAEGLEERLGQISRRMSVDDIIETFHHPTLGLNI
jgi:SulP family sulfate permease